MYKKIKIFTLSLGYLEIGIGFYILYTVSDYAVLEISASASYNDLDNINLSCFVITRLSLLSRVSFRFFYYFLCDWCTDVNTSIALNLLKLSFYI